MPFGGHKKARGSDIVRAMVRVGIRVADRMCVTLHLARDTATHVDCGVAYVASEIAAATTSGCECGC